jgi:NTE family protein
MRSASTAANGSDTVFAGIRSIVEAGETILTILPMTTTPRRKPIQVGIALSFRLFCRVGVLAHRFGLKALETVGEYAHPPSNSAIPHPSLHFRGVVAIASLLFVLAGCTNANRPLNDLRVQLENRRKNNTRATMFASRSPGKEIEPDANEQVFPAMPGKVPPADQDGYFVGLTISGGGSRSANFGAACMLQLQRLGLLQKVDYISGVSGGSLPVAYYCANGMDQWNPQIVQKKLTHPFASDLIGLTLLPWNWIATTVTDYDRTDMLASVFKQHLFTVNGHEQTFADLRPDRPRMLINSTDLQSGRRFIFTNESFDEINSNLAKYPLAYAVAASSAVPVLLHPVTLRDYSTTFPQYRHLIDGGVTDNLGIETLLDTYAGQRDFAIAHHLPDPYPHGAVFVVVDANTKYNSEISSKSDVGLLENLKVALGLTSSALVSRVDTANMSDIILRNSSPDRTARQLREEIRQLDETGYLEVIDAPGHTIRVIYLSLLNVNTIKNLPFGNFVERVNAIATYFNIADEEAYELYQAADLMVRERFEDKIKAIVSDLDAAATTRPSTMPAP